MKKKRTEAKGSNERAFASDTELLEFIKEKIEEQITRGEIKLKVGDFLKILEMQKKLASDSKAEEKFWEMIERIRQEELKDE